MLKLAVLSALLSAVPYIAAQADVSVLRARKFAVLTGSFAGRVFSSGLATMYVSVNVLMDYH
jgi:hypothetical protein